ncbi:MAG: hypothetical protein ABIA74_02965 [bacterium]
MLYYAEYSQNVYKIFEAQKKCVNSVLSFSSDEITPFKSLEIDQFKLILEFFFLMYFSCLNPVGVTEKEFCEQIKSDKELYLDAIKGLLIVIKTFYCRLNCIFFDLNYLYNIVYHADYSLLNFCLNNFFNSNYTNKIINKLYELDVGGKFFNVTLLDIALWLYFQSEPGFVKSQYLKIAKSLHTYCGVSTLFPKLIF